MRKMLFIALSLFIIGCSDHDDISRHNFGNGYETGNGTDNNENEEDEGYTELPGGDTTLPDDNDQKDDSTTRSNIGSIELRWGDPGVLYAESKDQKEAWLINIATGTKILINRESHMMMLDGVQIASSLYAIKEDSVTGKTWYHGTTLKNEKTEEGIPVYFVYEKLY